MMFRGLEGYYGLLPVLYDVWVATELAHRKGERVKKQRMNVDITE
jgi:hypothetical protein